MDTATHLLQEWGRWSRTHTGVALDFPARGVIGRVMDEGPAAGEASNREIPMPNLVAITEDILLKMPEDLRTALELKFVDRQPDRRACRTMHVGHTAYRERVMAGVAFLEGFIVCLGIKIFDADRSKS